MMRASLSRNTPPVENRHSEAPVGFAQALLFELEPLICRNAKPFWLIRTAYRLCTCTSWTRASRPSARILARRALRRSGVHWAGRFRRTRRRARQRPSSASSRYSFPAPGVASSASVSLQILDNNANLRSLCLRFAQALMVQAAHTALSNAVHEVDERLGRYADVSRPLEQRRIPLTHDFMSIMLGVRRSTVTTALHVLEGNGFIKADAWEHSRIIKRASRRVCRRQLSRQSQSTAVCSGRCNPTLLSKCL